MNNPDFRLYGVTEPLSLGPEGHVEVARRMLAGGATALQLRAKGLGTPEVTALGRRIRELCRETGALFIVNDDAEAALAADADGLHIGGTDMPVPEARLLLGPERLLGVSASTPEEALRAEEEGANHIGASPVFATVSKADAAPPMGLDGLAAICRATSLPVVAIGGIGYDELADIFNAGAAGAAVISALTRSDDIVVETRRFRRYIDDLATKEGMGACPHR